MNNNDLRHYSQQPDSGLFDNIQHRLRRRRAFRLAALTLAALIFVGGIGWTLSTGTQDAGQQRDAQVASLQNDTQVSHLQEVALASSLRNSEQDPSLRNSEALDADQPQAENPRGRVWHMPTPASVADTVAVVSDTVAEAVVSQPSPSMRRIATTVQQTPDRAKVIPVAAETPSFASETEPINPVASTSKPTPKVSSDTTILWAPNVIVPDGDEEKNRVFSFKYTSSQPVTDFRIFIYNRGGRQIYTSKDPAFVWDGTYNGSRLPQGAYVWVAQFRDANGQPHGERGTVTLIR